MGRPRATFYLAAILLSSLLGGLGAELVLRYLCVVCSWTEQNMGEYVSPYRMLNASTWYHLRFPNDVSSYGEPEFDYGLRTNSLGIRDIEHPVEKPDDELRIVGLGDSFTEGQGAEYEDGYLKVLERNLNRELKRGHVRVIVGGVAGSDPFYCFKLLKDKLLVYDPDLVTLTVNTTDVMDVVVRGETNDFWRTERCALPSRLGTSGSSRGAISIEPSCCCSATIGSASAPRTTLPCERGRWTSSSRSWRSSRSWPTKRASNSW